MFVFVIKKIRESKNITLSQLHEKTCISNSYLSEIERNKVINPSLKTVYTIATALDVKVDDLFYTELDTEDLKKEMYRRIDQFGLNSDEVMEISNLIDLLINIKFNDL